MELRKVAEVPCPTGIIAVAINNDNSQPHCGIVYTDKTGAVRLCDMKFENNLGVRQLPDEFFWTTVKLDPQEVLQIAVFVELVIEREKTYPLPYSFIYTPDGFDAAGRISQGVGFTCATFVVAIFDRLKFHVVDLASWRVRPKQDARFRDRIIRLANKLGYNELAARLKTEPYDFRLKPWELCGSAAHNRYPVRFCQAKKFAKVVSKLVRKYS